MEIDLEPYYECKSKFVLELMRIFPDISMQDWHNVEDALDELILSREHP